MDQILLLRSNVFTLLEVLQQSLIILLQLATLIRLQWRSLDLPIELNDFRHQFLVLLPLLYQHLSFLILSPFHVLNPLVQGGDIITKTITMIPWSCWWSPVLVMIYTIYTSTDCYFESVYVSNLILIDEASFQPSLYSSPISIYFPSRKAKSSSSIDPISLLVGIRFASLRS